MSSLDDCIDDLLDEVEGLRKKKRELNDEIERRMDDIARLRGRKRRERGAEERVADEENSGRRKTIGSKRGCAAVNPEAVAISTPVKPEETIGASVVGEHGDNEKDEEEDEDKNQGIIAAPFSGQKGTTKTETTAWSDALKRPGIRMFRIRIFKEDAKTTASDRYGSMPARWCSKKGRIVSAARLLPPEVTTPQEIADFLSSPDLVDRQKQLELIGTRYVTCYRCFLSMRAGDVVAMQLPGKFDSYCFGLVRDDAAHFLGRRQL